MNVYCGDMAKENQEKLCLESHNEESETNNNL